MSVLKKSLLIMAGLGIPAFFAGLATFAEGAPPHAGPITGRIVLAGPRPEPRELDPGRDRCCQEALPSDESLLVSDEGGLANVVIWASGPPIATVTGPPNLLEPSVHELTNKGCAFQPRVTLLRAGERLVLTNADPTTHNLNATFRKNPSFNVVLAPQARRELSLDAAEPKPAPVACNIHPFMRAWVLVRDDPYAAVSDASGHFELPAGLPAGQIRLTFWHEGRYLAGVPTPAGVTDRRGRIGLTLPLAEASTPYELGELRIDPRWFAAQ
ncbi:hypothetical protein [Botrimarina hoheduenensis]|uniref:Methylamine utilization protein n=1 Tax=Botrimarina hoheduenensis TaxID=2528000 RepID=A0A5C5VXZ2_9BACT|nr:hypothetical protein [Botrimarina hoheduenensis]TWT42865.1 hypothetical protein Pla111_25030 [Botrimarina hoheduenensis]